jgi:outer membrane protein assembly factor BamB
MSRPLTQSPYGAVTLSNDVAFTTTFDGTVMGLNTKTGKVIWKSKLPSNTNTPVAVAGNSVITAGSFPLKKPQIVTYRLP